MVLVPVTSDENGFVGDAPAVRDIVDLEERGWLARHCRGDAKAFPALLAAYRRPVYGYLVRTGVAPADRDDLFQTIFLNIHRAADRYQPARPLAPWLFTIVANVVRNHWRGAQPENLSTDSDTARDVTDPQPDPERALAARQTIAWTEQALAGLPTIQREVIMLIVVVGMPQQEVAQTLNLPVNTVKTHLRRARLALVAAHRAVHADGVGDAS